MMNFRAFAAGSTNQILFQHLNPWTKSLVSRSSARCTVVIVAIVAPVARVIVNKAFELPARVCHSILARGIGQSRRPSTATAGRDWPTRGHDAQAAATVTRRSRVATH